MKVEIKMTETAKEPYAVIFTNEMTEAVRQAAAILEGAVSNKAITVTDNEGSLSCARRSCICFG